MLLMSATFKFVGPPKPPEGAPDLQWDKSLLVPLGVVELACTLLYVFPRTTVLGAILLTGYLGGATAAHVRVHDAFFMPVLLGVLIWLGLLLREPRLWPLLPLTRKP
jgi:hypothetical protein